MAFQQTSTVHTPYQRVEIWKTTGSCEFRVAGAAHAWWHCDRFLTGRAWDTLAAAAESSQEMFLQLRAGIVVCKMLCDLHRIPLVGTTGYLAQPLFNKRRITSANPRVGRSTFAPGSPLPSFCGAGS